MTASDANNNLGINVAWERIRLLTRWLSRRIQRKKLELFEPGDIACCKGGLEEVFYDSLSRAKIPLDKWELRQWEIRKASAPYRFCIVNRHLGGSAYEVFLLTTFGRARRFEDIGLMGRYYGMPIGGTHWFDDTPGIKTFPALFGWKFTSFVLAIPAFSNAVLPTRAIDEEVRLIPGELERLRHFAHFKHATTRRDHHVIRESLRNRHVYINRANLSYDTMQDVQDLFTPQEVHDSYEPTAEKSDNEDLVPKRPQPYCLTRRPLIHKFPLPIRHDITWPMCFSAVDTSNFSTYLIPKPYCQHLPHQGRSSRVSLPRPYYAPCLRININAISRLIR